VAGLILAVEIRDEDIRTKLKFNNLNTIVDEPREMGRTYRTYGGQYSYEISKGTTP
jgi:hypothetical protein